MSETLEVCTVGQLRAALADCPDDRPILAQVAATNGEAWNMQMVFTARPRFLKWAAILTLRHDELKRLPEEAFTS